MNSSKDKNIKQQLVDQVKRTKELNYIIEKGAKQLYTLWYMLGYIAIILSLMLVKMIWW